MTFIPFLCKLCGYTSFDGQPHKCNPRIRKSSFHSRRYSKCINCIFNDRGICTQDSKNKYIENKIADFYEKCPKNFWFPVIIICNQCHEININTFDGVVKCNFCGKQLFEEIQFSDDVKVKNKASNIEYYAKYPSLIGHSNSIFSGVSSSFTVDKEKVEWVSSKDLIKDTISLIPKIPKDIDAIIGVARSGIPSASILSLILHLPLFIFRQSNRDVVYAGGGWRMHGTKIDEKEIKPKHPLVIDDTVFTGYSHRIAKEHLLQKYDNVTFASIYVNPKAQNFPDIWSIDLSWPHILEWNIFNSLLTPNSAFDFDGILCNDCKPDDDDDGPKYLNFIQNAEVKYIIKKCTIPLIVTARIEKYREHTINWLKENKINFKELIMHPAKNLQERNRDDIAAYKAKHYINFCKVPARPDPHIFFESDDRQARKIAEISKKLVVCPATGGCYYK